MVKPFLRILNISLKYGSQQVLNDVTFDLYKGRILALIGPNGAGKSSSMRILAGLVKPDNGRVEINGEEKEGLDKIHSHAGFFIESPAFYKNLTATQNLDLLQKIRGRKQSTQELINMVGLGEASHKKVGKFSKGMKQRLGIAQALINDPEILVLDEPFHGLDPEVKMFLMGLIKDLAMNEQKAILVSSHLLSDMENMADDFVLLHKGKIHLSGKLSDFKNERQKVTFRFKKSVLGVCEEMKFSGRITGTDSNKWEAILSVDETVDCIKKWGECGHIPYQVEREDLLHAKYMEITK